ncbi:MAG: nitrogen fixation protein NifZ [Sulfuritalea sp.]|jgi:nitrogen fixation protein NifZ|nr:nitrogen fixation protein NifZ [Sulfuritalea sp.]
MLPRWEEGDAVRVTRNVRNDGTFPGIAVGALLVRRGRIGHVRDIGTFLQDQIIYSVHFLDEARVIGCREEELIGLDEPWQDSRFETRQIVCAARALAIRGEVRVPLGSRGEILNVDRSDANGVVYHTHFDCLPGNPLQVPESALVEWGRGHE